MQVAHNKHLGEQEFRKKCGSEANVNKEEEHNYKHCKIHDNITDDDVNDLEEIHRPALNVNVSSQLHEFTKFRELTPEIREMIWKLAINTTFTEVYENNHHLSTIGYPEEEFIWCCKLMLRHAHTSSEARWIVARKMFRFGGDEYKHLTEKTMDRCIFPVVNEITLRKFHDFLSCSVSDGFSGSCGGILSDERKEENAKHLQKLLEA